MTEFVQQVYTQTLDTNLSFSYTTQTYGIERLSVPAGRVCTCCVPLRGSCSPPCCALSSHHHHSSHSPLPDHHSHSPLHTQSPVLPPRDTLALPRLPTHTHTDGQVENILSAAGPPVSLSVIRSLCLIYLHTHTDGHVENILSAAGPPASQLPFHSQFTPPTST